MSFILDALRRAETQRGYQPPQPATEATLDGIAAPVVARPSARTIAGALISVALLAAVLLYLMQAEDAPSSQLQPVASASLPTTPLQGVGADTPLAEVAATPRRVLRPLRSEAGAAPPAATAAPRNTPGSVVVAQQPLQSARPGDAPVRTLTNITEPAAEQLPGYKELVLSGRARLPDFHLDIHVYAADRSSRFVFVNNRKYKEGDSLDEGGTVERITAAGVVLNHRGYRFELLPD
ncbi:MAG: general secretion pathway protein GspB [Gammaproteobacteria bacterium]|nr:general secretion pathway protein GspB [Gammaproteobacteria bacterium]